MGYITYNEYLPTHILPIYIHIEPHPGNELVEKWWPGKHHQVRVEDPERQSERGGDGKYNYTHEVLVVGSWVLPWSHISDHVKGFAAYTQSEDEALRYANQHMKHGGKSSRETHKKSVEEHDHKYLVSCLLRLDKMKELFTEEYQRIEPPFEKEDEEGNG